ncbi:MAG TPA: adenylate/guanylate cyclase domain-containing protein [Actinomycetota bacterium]|nr:adenylate/guanylate cyclase domain-containing protein [Actinomycetota bacterium]
MPRLQRKSISAPDVVRTFPFGHVDVVNLDETSVARFTWEPGWRWSKHVAPVVRTTSCQNRHVGYVISGALHVVMDDGTELEIRAGDAFEIPPGHDAWVVGDEHWDTVEFTSAAVFGLTPDENESVLATILFTDIVDSTATLSQIGDAAWRRLLLQHNQAMRAQLDRYRGREMGTTGDGFLALFDGAARAVRCASAMITAVGELGLPIRAGLHTGEVAITGGQARGLAVHAAARVSALAGPGEILVSSTTRDLLDGSGLSFVSRGEHQLKGLTGTRTIYALETPRPAS